MSISYSFIAGVEKHHDSNIGNVGQAANDATAFAEALVKLGFEKENMEVLVDSKVTYTNLRFGISQILTSAKEDDTVFIFFSGHGFSAPSGPHLVAHDTRYKNFTETSLSLTEVFDWIRESKCRRIALFLDCCHAGLTFPAGEKSVLAGMDAGQLKNLFESSEFHVVFGSCKRSEKSHWYDGFGHGVWTYHLLQALTGKVPDILEEDRYLRAGNLQDYLAKAVPQTLREKFTDRKIQTPVLYGTITSNFLIADLDPVIPKSSSADNAFATGFSKASFGHNEEGKVSQLPGFDKKKGHFPPTDHSAFSKRFVAKVGDEDVQEKARSLFDSIKDTFGYTRQELTMDSDTGSSLIRAKDFDVALSLSQSSDDPAAYNFRLEVDGFSGGHIVAGDCFNEVFEGKFSFLQLLLEAEQDVPAIIDRIESKKPEGIEIDYSRDSDPDWVSISVDGQRAQVVVNRKSIKIKLAYAKPREFVEALNAAQGLSLGGKLTLGGLLFPVQRSKLK